MHQTFFTDRGFGSMGFAGAAGRPTSTRTPAGRSADRSNAGDLPGPCAYHRAMLINDLADIDNEVFAFLDDYHLVTDPAIRRAVSFLLRHVPSHLHLVLTTRLEPPLSLGGLLAKNRLLEVDASVLRFDYSFASRSRLVALAFIPRAPTAR